MSRKAYRDDFDKKTANALAKRASYICSNPACGARTLCPSEADPNKYIYVGKAAHITAASEGGPRFDPTLTPEQRSSIENGIFLCSVCADMVDKNGGVDFAVEQLRKWKTEHEAWARGNLNKSVTSLVSNPRLPEIDVLFDNRSHTVEILKKIYSDTYDERIKGELSNTIIRVGLVVVNTGTSPANDIDVILDFDGSFHIYTEKDLRRHWEIYPHNLFDNTEEFIKRIFNIDRRPAIERLHENVTNMFSFTIFEGLISEHNTRPQNSVTAALRAKINGNVVTFHINKLKQNVTRVMESLYVSFYSWDEVKSFDIKYRLNSEDIASDIEGVLRVDIRKESIKTKPKSKGQKTRQPKAGHNNSFNRTRN